jgi:hypothetical protein
MDELLRFFNLFVQHPERSALVSGVFFAIWLVLWSRSGRGATLRDRGLLIPASAWLLYAGYEFVVNRASPEANIRVDMLLIIPLLLVLTIIGIVLAVRPASRSPKGG